MSIRSLKRLKRRLIPVLAIAAAIVPTSAQAQAMLEGGSAGPATPRAHIWNSYDVGGMLVPANGTFQGVAAARPDDRGTRGAVVDEIQQPAPVPISAPSGGISWSDASYGALLGFVAALALSGMAIGLRRQKHGEPAV